MAFDNRGYRPGMGALVNRKDSYGPTSPIPRSNPDVALEDALAKEGWRNISKDLDRVTDAFLRQRGGLSRKGFLRVSTGPREEWEKA